MVDGGTRCSLSLSLFLFFFFSLSLVLSVQIGLVFPPECTHLPLTDTHARRYDCARSEGRKCTRITPGDASGMEDRKRKWTRQSEKGERGEATTQLEHS